MSGMYDAVKNKKYQMLKISLLYIILHVYTYLIIPNTFGRKSVQTISLIIISIRKK
jgi:hypothetical protein